MMLCFAARCCPQLSMFEARNKTDEANALYQIATKKFSTSKKVCDSESRQEVAAALLPPVLSRSEAFLAVCSA